MANKVFTLRFGTESQNMILESLRGTVSIDLCADFGDSNSDFWKQHAIKLMDELEDYPATGILFKAIELSQKMAEDYQLKDNASAVLALRTYCTYMLTEALYQLED